MFEVLGFVDLVIAVFVGNIITVSVVLSLRSLDKANNPGEYSWTALAGVILPCVVTLLYLYPKL